MLSGLAKHRAQFKTWKGNFLLLSRQYLWYNTCVVVVCAGGCSFRTCQTFRWERFADTFILSGCIRDINWWGTHLWTGTLNREFLLTFIIHFLLFFWENLVLNQDFFSVMNISPYGYWGLMVWSPPSMKTSLLLSSEMHGVWKTSLVVWNLSLITSPSSCCQQNFALKGEGKNVLRSSEIPLKLLKILNPETVLFRFQFTKPQILFVDVNIGQLDYFMHGLKRKTDRRKSIFRKKAQIYKAVSSTENETLLFPEHIDTEICRRIAICLAEQRTS